MVLSTDEMSGVQALERNHPKLPMAPGKVERQEFEYKWTYKGKALAA